MAQSFSADHPRACGANMREPAVTFDVHGSSPRMRGKPKADAGDVETRRIIPAHAGQTMWFRRSLFFLVFRQVGVSCLVMYFFRV